MTLSGSEAFAYLLRGIVLRSIGHTQETTTCARVEQQDDQVVCAPESTVSLVARWRMSEQALARRR